MEALTCTPGKIKEFHDSFDKLAPACLPLLGVSQLKRHYVYKLPPSISKQLVTTMTEHGLQKLKASAIQLELLEHRDAKGARVNKGPNPDRLKCHKCGGFYWREKGC